MKNLVFISVLLHSIVSYTQVGIPVIDAGTNAGIATLNGQVTYANTTLSELLAIQTTAKGEAISTTSNTLNTLKEAEKMREMFSKVSGYISKSKLVAKIFEKSTTILQTGFDIQIAINKANVNKELKKTVTNKATDFMNNAEPLFEMVNTVLKDNTIKGNDSDRLSILLNISDKLDEVLEDLQALAVNSLILNGINYELKKVD